MKKRITLPVIFAVVAACVIAGCTGRTGRSDLYILEELETAAAVDDPDGRIERLEKFIAVYKKHPYRVQAINRILETIVVDKEDLPGAEAFFSEVLDGEKDPEIRGELLYEKFAYLWDADRERAIGFASELLESGESYYKLFLYLGYYLMYEEGSEDLADECLKRSAECTEDPFKKSHIMYVYGELLDKLGKREEAVDVLSGVSGYVFANEILGEALWEEGKREEAIEAYVRLAAGAPGMKQKVKLDSLYAVVYPGEDGLDGKLMDARINDEGEVPDMDFVDIEGKRHSISAYRGQKLVISAWSPT